MKSKLNIRRKKNIDLKDYRFCVYFYVITSLPLLQAILKNS